MHRCQGLDETHVDSPRNAIRASRRNARVTVSVVGHESGLSIQSHVEVTTGYAKAYAKASKKDKGRVQDTWCGFAIPRDRDGTFTPRLAPKGSRRVGGPG